jgi:hypothetical protein
VLVRGRNSWPEPVRKDTQRLAALLASVTFGATPRNENPVLSFKPSKERKTSECERL